MTSESERRSPFLSVNSPVGHIKPKTEARMRDDRIPVPPSTPATLDRVVVVRMEEQTALSCHQEVAHNILWRDTLSGETC